MKLSKTADKSASYRQSCFADPYFSDLLRRSEIIGHFSRKLLIVNQSQVGKRANNDCFLLFGLGLRIDQIGKMGTCPPDF